MSFLDNYMNIIKIQLAGPTAGTTKYGWLESATEMMSYAVLIALCFSHKWYVPAWILIGLVVVMVFIVMKK